MTFEEIPNQAMALLQRQGLVSYRALKRQFDLDEAYVEDLKLELIEVHRVAVDQDNAMLMWIGGAAGPPSSAANAVLGRTRAPDAAPLTYTPPHLTDKILAARSRPTATSVSVRCMRRRDSESRPAWLSPLPSTSIAPWT